MLRSYRPGSGIDLPAPQSGRWYRLPACATFGTSATATGTMHATPKFIAASVTLDRLGAEVTTVGEAGSKVRLGIYADDGTYRPGALVLDAGTINGDSNTVQSLTVSQALTRGWYWFAMVNQVVVTTNPTWRTSAAIVEPMFLDTTSTPAAGGAVLSFTTTGVTGALPASFGTPGRANFGTAVHGRVA
jgi:hypothetical protein